MSPLSISSDLAEHRPLQHFHPLLGHTSAHQIIAWRDGKSIDAATFLRDVYALIPLLPTGQHILNDCLDRYRFLVVLCAAMVAGKINLLPSTRTAETVRELQLFAPDVACVTDQKDCTIALPQIFFPADSYFENIAERDFVVPQIEASQIVAYVFTSGSTGVPIGHCKTWASLVSNVQTEALQFGLLTGKDYHVVGTVSAQHMFGLESTVLMPLINGFALTSARSFYPADICQSLTQVPEPRILITTPIHLRSLLGAKMTLPKIELIVSATAPLSPQLAAEAEQAFDVPLQEIYGSTETGQIASRRPTQSPEWVLFPTLTMQPARSSNDDADQDGRESNQDQRMWISGGHVTPTMPMNDVLEITATGRFLLHGRISDLINIAGKRSSLACLNHHLNAIPGVQDGVFYMSSEKNNGEVTRLQAVVVAPDLSKAEIISALREKIDPAFMPRPLHQVAQLPRNATGKLPQTALDDLMHTLNAGNGNSYNNSNVSSKVSRNVNQNINENINHNAHHSDSSNKAA